ncbi:MAG TPA: hypothetical protein PLI51_08765, partial [bacterium]|nr:hypothetical protein [bacterium]
MKQRCLIWAAAAAFSAGVLHAEPAWRRVLPPPGADLYGVWCPSTASGWAVGDGGTILRYDGTDWIREGTAPDADFRAVWGASTDSAWAVGRNGRIARFQGSGWTEVSSGTELDLYAIWGANDGDIWVGGDSYLFGHFDGGSWQMQTMDVPPLPESAVRSISGTLPDNLNAFGPMDWFPVSLDPPVYEPWAAITHYDGVDWQISTFIRNCPVMRCSFAPQSEAVVAGGDGGRFLIGMPPNWMSLTSPAEGAVTGIWTDLNVLQGVGSGGVWLYLEGGHWSWAYAGTRENLNAMYSTTDGPRWAVGGNGIVVGYDTERAIPWWVPYNPVTGDTLRDVWGGEGVYRAVGEAGTVLAGDGDSWTVMTVLSDSKLLSVWGTSPEDFWAAGEYTGGAATSGIIWHYDSGSWHSPVIWNDRPVNGIWGLGPDDVYAVCPNGTVAYYDGSFWNYMTSAYSSPIALYDIWGTAPDNLWATGKNTAADYGVFWHYQGADWVETTTYGAYRSLWGDGSDSIWAAGMPAEDIFVGLIGYYDGVSWELQTYSQRGIFYGLWGGSQTDVWAAGGNPVLGCTSVIYHWDGSAWSDVTTTGDSALYGVSASGSGSLAVCGAAGSVFLRGADVTPPRYPPAADFDGDGTSDIALYRPSTGAWLVRSTTRAFFGDPSDLPVPADYDGDGTTDVAVYRAQQGKWLVRGGLTAWFGNADDSAVPADYDGDGT